MAIQLPDKIAAQFSYGEWGIALKLLCSERIEKAQKRINEIDPLDSIGIARLQEEIRVMEKFLGIELAVIKFEETQAASKILK